jgi:hypothetical protein
MARARQRTPRNPWKASDVKTLRSLARKHSAGAIAKKLNRTESAIWQRAHVLKISLRLP